MNLRPRLRAATGTIALCAAVLCAAVLCAASAGPAKASGPAPAVSCTFRTLDNAKGRSFNQLLGINNHGKIVGYFGSGAQGHPNRGYLLAPPYGQGSYHAENVRGAAQTQVTGLNSTGVSVKAFYITQGTQTRVHEFAFPGADLTQAFGVNDHGEVVGAYTTGGQTFGFTWTVKGHFRKVNDPRGKGTTVINAINSAGVLVGFFTSQNGDTHGMLATP